MPMPASLTVLWVHLFTPLMPSILLEQEALELLELLCILSNLMIKIVSLKIMFLRTVSACRYDQVSYHYRSQTWLSLFILFPSASLVMFLSLLFLPMNVSQGLPQDTSASLDQHVQSTLRGR